MSQKTVIALCGRRNTGKSTTLKAVRSQIEKLGTLVKKLRRSQGADYADIWKVNGVLVGLTTLGDVPKDLDKYFAAFIGAGCDLIICAHHPEGETQKSVDALKAKGFSIKRIDKDLASSESVEEATNSFQAAEILELVKSYCGL